MGPVTILMGPMQRTRDFVLFNCAFFSSRIYSGVLIAIDVEITFDVNLGLKSSSVRFSSFSITTGTELPVVQPGGGPYCCIGMNG